jgi:hypothetical protein
MAARTRAQNIADDSYHSDPNGGDVRFSAISSANH